LWTRLFYWLQIAKAVTYFELPSGIAAIAFDYLRPCVGERDVESEQIKTCVVESSFVYEMERFIPKGKSGVVERAFGEWVAIHMWYRKHLLFGRAHKLSALYVYFNEDSAG